MKTKQGIFKAEVKGGMDLKKLETLVTSRGGTMLRVDQEEDRTTAFFAGDRESAKQARKALAQYGKVLVRPVSEAALLKLP